MIKFVYGRMQVNGLPSGFDMDIVDRMFSIGSDADFECAALELFDFQSRHCDPYARYVELLGIDRSSVRHSGDIPMLPIELFKTHDVYCGEKPPQAIFTSSATTGMTSSHHMMADLSLYERDFRACFERFYGEPSRWSLYALLPNYLQRKGSSLVYMADRLIRECGSGGFYLDDYDRLAADMAADAKPKILLGVTYALLDMAERGIGIPEGTVVMETGGMKGRRREMPKEELHALLCGAFGVESIHSEYGMAELTSQAYSSGNGLFYCPPWMKVLTRDVNDPFARLEPGRRGGIDIIDLGNVWSCAFLQTQDAGTVFADGGFRIEGRLSGSDIRGCNLLVQ